MAIENEQYEMMILDTEERAEKAVSVLKSE